jgi:hypothetical protein
MLAIVLLLKGASIMPFKFSLNSFALTNTRAVHEDTDYVVLGLTVNGTNPFPPLAQRAGNVNNETYNIKDMDFLLNSIGENDQIVLSYLVINHGGDKSAAVLTACQNAITKTALKTFNAAYANPVEIQGRNLPSGLTNTLRTAAEINPLWDLVKSQFSGLSTDHCDGPVAIEQVSFYGKSVSGIELISPVSIIYDGIDSATGCGSNSHYSVQWGITAV